MQDQSGNDHQGKEDVERNRDRNMWKTQVNGDSDPGTAPYMGMRGSYHNTCRYIIDVSPERHQLVCGEFKHVPTVARYIRQGNATTQRFMEYIT